MSNDTKKAARTHNGRTARAPAAGSETNGARLSIDDQIRLRAYELYLARGAQPNDDLTDWLRAERELRVELAAEPPEPRAS